MIQFLQMVADFSGFVKGFLPDFFKKSLDKPFFICYNTPRCPGEPCPPLRQKTFWRNSSVGQSNRFIPGRSSVRIQLPLPGPLVKWLRHRPFTAVTAVRICYGSPPKSREIPNGFSGFFLFSGLSGRNPDGLTNLSVLCYNPQKTGRTFRSGRRKGLIAWKKCKPTMEQKPVRTSAGGKQGRQNEPDA